MTFGDWVRPIIEQIKVPATANFGHIGYGYNAILVVEPIDTIRPIGEFVYNFFVDHWKHNVSEEMRVEFGKQCERYRIGDRASMPSLCYRFNQISINGDDEE